MMDVFIVILEAAVVLGAIVLGVKTGGLGLGLWGVFGTLILVFVFRLPPGSPPVDAFFIVIAVITAAAAMQAAGGIDYLVSIASKIIQANPKPHLRRAARLVRLHGPSRAPRTSSSRSSR
ncbi:MAG: anaerobic C4-dicarboxylate transporter family protein [Microbacterium sp.]